MEALTIDGLRQMLIDAGRRCKGCGSADIALFSMPRVGEGVPFTLDEIGEVCWCQACGTLLIAEEGHA